MFLSNMSVLYVCPCDQVDYLDLCVYVSVKFVSVHPSMSSQSTPTLIKACRDHVHIHGATMAGDTQHAVVLGDGDGDRQPCVQQSQIDGVGDLRVKATMQWGVGV